MPQWPDFEPTRLLKHLTARGLDFVVIGGIAAILHGSNRLTQDLDIAYAPDRANLETLGRALIALDAKLAEVEEGVPFVPDAETLRKVELLTLDTAAGPLDLLGRPPGALSYDTLRRRADRYDVGGVAVLTASVEDLIAMKRAAGRPQDLADIAELEAILRLRAS